MQGKKQKNSISIRIPSDYYIKLKELAASNRRNLISELIIILDDYLTGNLNLDTNKRLKAYSKIRGVIKNLPKKNYGQTVDDVLYKD